MAAHPLVTSELLVEIRRQFRIDLEGIHGATHWGRVHRHGMYLARLTGADHRVVELFAFLHDSQREDEWEDPGHGARASEYARWLVRRGALELDAQALALVTTACDGHSDGGLEADITVQVCWDADRLDLGRVGIRPDPRRLCTAAARCPRYIEAAWRWSRGGRRPAILNSGRLSAT